MDLRRLWLVPTQSCEWTPLGFDHCVLASRVAGGCSGVLPGDRGKGTIIRGVDLVQDLVGRIDDVRPERKVLGKGKPHFWFGQRG